jgi:hypothetical protein
MSRYSSRVLLIALALLLVLGVSTAFFAIRDGINNNVAMANQTACDLLTLNDAKTLLNDTAKKSDDTAGNKETADLSKSRCSYVTQGAGLQDIWTLTLELRIAKTDDGKADNASYFTPNKTDDQQVAGYGDEARWDAYSGRLSVLRGGDFYLVSMTKGFGGNTVVLADVQKAAEAVGLKE